MTPLGSPRPPYRAALAVSLLVLTGYILTLAPTVTFWDAGEFIAATRTLGIPHPPGTPLFVMIAHVWAAVVPFGEYALRTNFLSALFSATGAGFLFLVAHQSLRAMTQELEPETGRFLQLGGAGAAALLGAFTFTNWQNSNETEVYAVATFTIAAMAWLAHVWRGQRGSERASRTLLLIIYLAGVSIGNHLLALLAGPGVVAFIWATLRQEPAPHPADRRAEWGQLAVVAGVWALLIGTGLGNMALTAIGALCFLGAAGYAATGGAGGFALASLAIAGVGITPYLFAFIRSAQNPAINEAAPKTLDALLAVIRRAQYPPRTPLDDPTIPHGPDNPGRTASLIGLQLMNYFQYFNWQWARTLSDPIRAVITVGFFALGFRGTLAQRKADRAAWWLLLGLFLVTGLGLVAYMNFRPGFSLGFDRYPRPEDHEVRERDYFFVVSFIIWGIWAGLGLAALVRDALRPSGWRRRVAPALLLLTLVPIALNWKSATRRGADAHLAANFAYNLLNSAPPYGVLFTYGDNDTFPLWWAQEVAAIRQDVTVICLALANTDWYMRQLRDNPTRPADPGQLPPPWRDSLMLRPTWALHSMSDSMIATAMNGYYVSEPQQVSLGPIKRTLEQGTVLYPSDILSLSVIQQNLGRRPIVWGVATGRSFAGLGGYIIQQGMGFRLQTAAPDTTASARLDLHRLAGVPLDLPTTETLVWQTYRYGELLEKSAVGLEPTSASVAASLALPYVQLVYAEQSRGDREKMERALIRAEKLSPNPELRAALIQLLEPRDTAPLSP